MSYTSPYQLRPTLYYTMRSIPHITYKNYDPFSLSIANYLIHGDERKRAHLPAIKGDFHWTYEFGTDVFMLVNDDRVVCVVNSEDVISYGREYLESYVKRYVLQHHYWTTL